MEDKYGNALGGMSDGKPRGYGSVSDFLEMAKHDRNNVECMCMNGGKQGHCGKDCPTHLREDFVIHSESDVEDTHHKSVTLTCIFRHTIFSSPFVATNK